MGLCQMMQSHRSCTYSVQYKKTSKEELQNSCLPTSTLLTIKASKSNGQQHYEWFTLKEEKFWPISIELSWALKWTATMDWLAFHVLFSDSQPQLHDSHLQSCSHILDIFVWCMACHTKNDHENSPRLVNATYSSDCVQIRFEQHKFWHDNVHVRFKITSDTKKIKSTKKVNPAHHNPDALGNGQK